ncbi:MAG TPA: DNA replication/repair protein RecF [Mycobacteriales bacterium]|nr:DNA replication/repair protein RecF [Mycobacteriales bacterium]
MYASRLAVTDFRSYDEVDLTFDRGISLLVGPNGQGKTNIAEALGYVATLGSHRVATDAPLVRAGAARAVVRAQVERAGRTLLVELEITPGKANRARINGANVRPRDVLGALKTVLFAPEDLALVKGDPSERRRFLDDLLVARAPRFAAVRADYERVTKQRSALLKTASLARRAGPSGDMSTLDVWDAHLATAGAELLAARLELVQALSPLVDKAYTAVSNGSGPATLTYKASLEEQPTPALGGTDRSVLEAALLAEIARRRTEEIDRGVCLVGPHRDDLLLSLGALPAKGYASHGESWSFALALRLASYDLLRNESTGDLSPDDASPVLVLDDVFAELDSGRRERLAAVVADAPQVLITAAVVEDVPEVLSGARYDVMAGRVTRVV